MVTNYVVSTGNAFDGVTLHGPFGSIEAAEQFAENECDSEEWTFVPIAEASQEKGCSTIVLSNVDLALLQQQYERLQEVTFFIEEADWHGDVPDATILDGVVEMLGDVLPYPQTEDEARTCKHGNRIWFGHECGLC
jgi:hypothetical protein